jgi:hypothetical protein
MGSRISNSIFKEILQLLDANEKLKEMMLRVLLKGSQGSKLPG